MIGVRGGWTVERASDGLLEGGGGAFAGAEVFALRGGNETLGLMRVDPLDGEVVDIQAEDPAWRGMRAVVKHALGMFPRLHTQIPLESLVKMHDAGFRVRRVDTEGWIHVEACRPSTSKLLGKAAAAAASATAPADDECLEQDLGFAVRCRDSLCMVANLDEDEDTVLRIVWTDTADHEGRAVVETGPAQGQFEVLEFEGTPEMRAMLDDYLADQGLDAASTTAVAEAAEPAEFGGAAGAEFDPLMGGRLVPGASPYRDLRVRRKSGKTRVQRKFTDAEVEQLHRESVDPLLARAALRFLCENRLEHQLGLVSMTQRRMTLDEALDRARTLPRSALQTPEERLRADPALRERVAALKLMRARRRGGSLAAGRVYEIDRRFNTAEALSVVDRGVADPRAELERLADAELAERAAAAPAAAAAAAPRMSAPLGGAVPQFHEPGIRVEFEESVWRLTVPGASLRIRASVVRVPADQDRDCFLELVDGERGAQVVMVDGLMRWEVGGDTQLEVPLTGPQMRTLEQKLREILAERVPRRHALREVRAIRDRFVAHEFRF